MGYNDAVRGRMANIICSLLTDKLRSRFMDPGIQMDITVEWRVSSVGKYVFTPKLGGIPIGLTLRPRSLQYGDTVPLECQIAELDTFVAAAAKVVKVEHLGITT